MFILEIDGSRWRDGRRVSKQVSETDGQKRRKQTETDTKRERVHESNKIFGKIAPLCDEDYIKYFSCFT